MAIVKNTFGLSVVVDPFISNPDKINQFTGSALDRKKYPKKEKDLVKQILDTPIQDNGQAITKRLRSMSPRSKSKIRKKIISFARVQKKLSFLTLTFVNKVDDTKAIKVLHSFLDNVVKRSKDFQYLWVAEKQTKNKVFKDNIHFHLITNKFWKIDRWWKYWLEIQLKFGITPRDKNYKPSSAFDVKNINSNNIRGIVKYLTKYVTKNDGQFGCQVWNCSKKISRLYTDFYTDIDFLRQLQRLERDGVLGGEIKTIRKEFCLLNFIPLNNRTTNFYNRIDEKNLSVWNNEAKQKEVKNEA